MGLLKSMAKAPMSVVKAWVRTAKGIPHEWSQWRHMSAQQGPIVYDQAFASSEGIDPSKVYVLPIPYRILFFWLLFKVNGGEATNANAYHGFFRGWDVKSFLGTVFASRASDAYCFATARWLGIWGPEKSSFSLDKVVRVQIVDIEDTKLEAAEIGLIDVTATITVGNLDTIRIPVLGEDCIWYDAAGQELIGVAAIAAFLEAQVALSQQMQTSAPP